MNAEAQATREMPKYKCHKEVWALKIGGVNVADNGDARLSFVENGYAPVEVCVDWMHRHRPKQGGYYVVYADGYKSFSPAEAFESGYTRMST